MEEASLLKGWLFMPPRPADEMTEVYVKEALVQGILHPSTFPISSGFIFVKKDGGLRLHIDYQALNTITCKYHEPLSLIP